MFDKKYRISAVECLLQRLTGPGGLAWKSVLLNLDTESDDQSLSSYTAFLRNQGSMTSTCTISGST